MDGGIESGSTITTDSMDEEVKTSSIDSLIVQRKSVGSVGDMADILIATTKKKVLEDVSIMDRDEGQESEDDELTDHSVNLVVLDEVAGKKFSKFFFLT